MTRFRAGATHLIEGDDPIRVLARLLGTESLGDYVLYEDAAGIRLACDPVGRVTVESGRICWSWSGRSRQLPVDRPILPQVGKLLNGLDLEHWTACGYATFELGAGADGNTTGGPQLDLIIPGTEARVIGDRVHVRSLDEAGSARMLRRLAAAGARRENPRGTVSVDVAADQRAGYETTVRRALEHVSNNELTKVIVSRRVRVPFEVDMPGTFAEGRRRLHPKRSFLLHLGAVRAVGFSPETVVEVTADGRVTAQPLAGTRACGRGPQRDESLRRDLVTNAKEVYEHAVSVRAARDELASVCRPGSISLDEFLAVRQRGSVQHLATTMRGTLRTGCTAWDAARVMFPAVTASGIPKPDACRLIGCLEGRSRRLYGGAVMVAEAGGALDAALVLRAVVDDGEGPFLQAGAGVVAQSDPYREFTETCEKLEGIAQWIVPRHGVGDGVPMPATADDARVPS